MYKAQKRAILTAVVVTITMASIAFFLTVNLSALLIHYPVGMSVSRVRGDYWRLLRYLQLPGRLDFTYIPISQHGLRHFADVKIYIVLNELLMLVLAGISFTLTHKLKRRGQLWLLLAPLKWIMCIVLVGVVMSAVNFDTIFVGTHYMLFNNLDWILDQGRDPVILLMPVGFFTRLYLLWAGMTLFFLALFWIKICLSLKLRLDKSNHRRNQGYHDNSQDNN
ncbi:MAG: TIGR01906 family membrane protein [Limosilactobacillus sp.]|uniref:TIGR01906 family membrane protein n=1 Tax=Limosilactobacillus sp. TaxID=2773925 RepID=UPI0026F5C23A|nr:TIGR01906 family membrane protein [Limosilactobacillus sp.]